MCLTYTECGRIKIKLCGGEKQVGHFSAVASQSSPSPGTTLKIPLADSLSCSSNLGKDLVEGYKTIGTLSDTTGVFSP